MVADSGVSGEAPRPLAFADAAVLDRAVDLGRLRIKMEVLKVEGGAGLNDERIDIDRFGAPLVVFLDWSTRET